MLRPPIQPEKCGLKFKMVLKWNDVYIENIRVVPMMAGLKREGIVKWSGLKSQGQLYTQCTRTWYSLGAKSVHYHVASVMTSI